MMSADTVDSLTSISTDQDPEIEKYLTDKFDYDELSYTTLDYRGAAVATVQQVDQLAVELIKSLNNLQLIYGGVSAIGIAIGFLMLNTGSISLKNTNTMLRVSLIENMVCAVCIWCLGYRVSMDSIGGLIGTGLDFDIFRSVPETQSMKFIVLFACAQFTSSITTGALAERTYVDTQIAFKVMLNVLIFPIIASWVWGGGWLAKYGYQDYGGSGVVHIVGGTCGLVGAAILGPRLGLFNDSLPIQENKIREKLERLEHQFQNLQSETVQRINQLRQMTIEYNQYQDDRKNSMLARGDPHQKLKQTSQSWQLTNQLYGTQEMVKRTVTEIYRKTYNLQAVNDLSQQSRKTTFTQQKTWEALKQDPLFQKSLQRQKSSTHQHQQHVRNQSDSLGNQRRSFANFYDGSGAGGTSNGNASQQLQHSKIRKQTHQRKKNSKHSMDSNDSDYENELDLKNFNTQAQFDHAETSSAFQQLSKKERQLMMNIMKTDSKIKQNNNKLQDFAEKIEKLRRKYVNAFRVRNQDLRHFKTEQIKDYTDMLLKESQNLRQPNSTILVAGGVLFIFFGTLSLSILITRVFYRENQIDGDTHEIYLKQAGDLMQVGFLSMIDKLASVSGSVAAVLLLKPLIYGTWRTQEQTSCVYNVETISSSVIAGIASVAGASGYVAIHSSAIIGACGGVIYLLSSILLNRYQLDDPLQATQTHLFCGLWGVVAFGLVHQEKGLLTTGQGAFLGIQLVGAVVIFMFTFILTFVFFQLVRRRFHLRLTKVEEVLGSDLMEDERVMQSFVANFLTNFDREQRAKINLIQLVKTGMHQSKRKQRKVDQDFQDLDYINPNARQVSINNTNSTASRSGGLSTGLHSLAHSFKDGSVDNST